MCGWAQDHTQILYDLNRLETTVIPKAISIEAVKTQWQECLAACNSKLFSDTPGLEPNPSVGNSWKCEICEEGKPSAACLAQSQELSLLKWSDRIWHLCLWLQLVAKRWGLQRLTSGLANDVWEATRKDVMMLEPIANQSMLLINPVSYRSKRSTAQVQPSYLRFSHPPIWLSREPLQKGPLS